MYDTPSSEKARGNLVSMNLPVQKKLALNKIIATLFPCALKPVRELVQRLFEQDKRSHLSHTPPMFHASICDALVNLSETPAKSDLEEHDLSCSVKTAPVCSLLYQ